MPWSPDDAAKHSKAITSAKARRAWSAVANSALDRCLKAGGKQSDCEGKAIAQANAVAKNIKESDPDTTVDAVIEAALQPVADATAFAPPPAVDAGAAHPSGAGAPSFLEAVTLKHRAHALLRDLDALLADKGLGTAVHEQLDGMRTLLRKRWADLTDPPAETTPATEAARWLAEATDVLRQDDSVDSRRQMLSQALMRWGMQQQASDTDSDPGLCPMPYIRDLFDGAVVFDWQGQCYRADYTMGADDTVTVADPVPVEVAYVPVAERQVDQKTRDAAAASDFAGKNQSFPILKPEDVAAAAASIGRAGPDNYSPDELKARIIAIARRKGPAFVAQLPQAWKDAMASSEAAGLDAVADADVVVLTEVATDLELAEVGALVEA